MRQSAVMLSASVTLLALPGLDTLALLGAPRAEAKMRVSEACAYMNWTDTHVAMGMHKVFLSHDVFRELEDALRARDPEESAYQLRKAAADEDEEDVPRARSPPPPCAPPTSRALATSCPSARARAAPSPAPATPRPPSTSARSRPSPPRACSARSSRTTRSAA